MKVHVTLSRNKVFVVAGQGTSLLPIPWFVFAVERLLEYTKLAFLTQSSLVDKQAARGLQAQFLANAPELEGLLTNGEDILQQDIDPIYSKVVTNITLVSKRSPPNIFSDTVQPEQAHLAVPEARSHSQLDHDVNLVRTWGATATQLEYNRRLRRVSRDSGEKYHFCPPSQTLEFKHAVPEKIRPGVQSSRQNIVVKDFRDILHSLSGMPLEKKDLPPIWYKLIKGLNKCQGASKTGLRERDALLHHHCLAFMMKMTFNLTNLLNELLRLEESGSLSVRDADRKDLDSYFLNFKLSRDLLDQFEQEFYEFSQASTWTDLSLFDKKVKIAEFFHHFCTMSADAPRLWSKGNFGIFMSPETKERWSNYFSHAVTFKGAKEPEPRATFAKKPATTTGATPRKGVTGKGVTDFRNRSQGRGKGSGRGRGKGRGRGGRGRRNRRNRRKKKKVQVKTETPSKN